MGRFLLPSLGPPTSGRRASILQAALIVIAAWVVYGSALHGAWLWDDPQYVTANPLLQDPARLMKAWFVPGSYMEYYPLQETVIWLQWQLWGREPLGYHLTNCVLHLGSGLLLWRLFARLGLRLAWLGGLIFVVHPLNVESVAWISELKNTLSLPPLLLAMLAMVRYVDTRRRADYGMALAFFTVAMLAKISMAPFPFVILLYIWWKRGRLTGNDLRLAAPFLAVAVVLASLTVWAYLRYGELHPGHPFIPTVGGLGARVSLAGLTVSFYFARFFFPWDPMPMYPQGNPVAGFLFWFAWAALLGWLWQNREGWGRDALLGIGFFLLMIAPFSGLVTQSYMYFTWVMDHFLYIPMIGLIGLSIAAWEKGGAGLTAAARSLGSGLLGLWLVSVTWQSRAYAAQWSDGGRLWSYAVEKNPGAWLARYNLGNDDRREGRYEDAIGQYRAALQINPSFDWLHNNLGISLAEFPGRLPEAMAEYRAALRLRPDFPEAHNNLANALSQTGRLPEAIAEYHAALASQPDFLAARYNLSLALAKAGRIPEAVQQLREILHRQPDFVPAQDLLERLGAR